MSESLIGLLIMTGIIVIAVLVARRWPSDGRTFERLIVAVLLTVFGLIAGNAVIASTLYLDEIPTALTQTVIYPSIATVIALAVIARLGKMR